MFRLPGCGHGDGIEFEIRDAAVDHEVRFARADNLRATVELRAAVAMRLRDMVTFGVVTLR